MPIRVLDEKTIARIAAGEVIERPASVVKELVENALDAGATQITVEVRDGGVAFIRVIDNAGGIASAEAELAFQRHATSKLTRIDDLERLTTLGFRGEALPSIAAVADVEMVTAADGSAGGALLALKDGVIITRTSQARSRGTTITVKSLFRSVPARLKFLKSTATENSHIAAVVTRYALAFPEVKFVLLSEGRTVLQTTGTGRLLDVVIAVYGAEIAQKMVAITAAAAGWQAGAPADISVTGMVSSPVLSRAGRDALHFFVNRRAIDSRLLTYAVEEAYTGLLMQGRHPLAVINITLPPALVDVNVHPAKSEVKFRDERVVFAVVQKAVRGTLVTLAPIPRIEEVGRSYTGTRPSPPIGRATWSSAPAPTNDSVASVPEAVQSPLSVSLPALRVLGQVAGNYIVAEGPDGVYVIDQHAAHERILYEKVKREKESAHIEVQGLLEAATLEVTPAQDMALRECCRELQTFGFTLEPFGERSYLVRTVPAVLSRGDWSTALREMLDCPSQAQAERDDSICKTIACHGAVRAGKTLSDEEMRALVRQLEQTENPFTCPHGRPTLIHLSKRQMEREFGRV
ncbi:MAG: DNA mismatch repair endonuclease MutL [Dehalococcoidia bacterium]|nr:DNA mismatch repair endonuclease MutL [Dehalococcoidia bacterium]